MNDLTKRSQELREKYEREGFLTPDEEMECKRLYVLLAESVSEIQKDIAEYIAERGENNKMRLFFADERNCEKALNHMKSNKSNVLSDHDKKIRDEAIEYTVKFLANGNLFIERCGESLYTVDGMIKRIKENIYADK